MNCEQTYELMYGDDEGLKIYCIAKALWDSMRYHGPRTVDTQVDIVQCWILSNGVNGMSNQALSHYHQVMTRVLVKT